MSPTSPKRVAVLIAYMLAAYVAVVVAATFGTISVAMLVSVARSAFRNVSLFDAIIVVACLFFAIVCWAIFNIFAGAVVKINREWGEKLKPREGEGHRAVRHTQVEPLSDVHDTAVYAAE